MVKKKGRLIIFAEQKLSWITGCHFLFPFLYQLQEYLGITSDADHHTLIDPQNDHAH